MIQQRADIGEIQNKNKPWRSLFLGRKKWDQQFLDTVKKQFDNLNYNNNSSKTDAVLDVLAGTSGPELVMKTTLKEARIILPCSTEKKVTINHKNAIPIGCGNNKTEKTTSYNISQLPFGTNTFDTINYRVGFMFFPEIEVTAGEMLRILKPGGKLTISIWSVPEKNYWISVILATIDKNIRLSLPSIGIPGILHCAHDGLISTLFSDKGLGNITIEEIKSTMKCRVSDVYANMIIDSSSPFASLLENIEGSTREKIKKQIYEAMREKYHDGKVELDSSTLIISGEKQGVHNSK
jgi:SAM-dependent methyltransferase